MGPVVKLIAFIITAFLLEDSVSAQCSRTTPPCNLECHCQPGPQCSVTGCDTGVCQKGWDGPTCQRENIVLGFYNNVPGTIGYSSLASPFISLTATDGSLMGNYFRTTRELNPYLWINLRSVQTVYALSVFTTAYDFQIFINYIASRDGATLCRSNNAAQATATRRYDVTCFQPLNGQYVWITRPGSINRILEVTEMEIYRCSDFWFGVQCDKSCNCQTRDEVCNKATGKCQSGCATGYAQPDCQVCIDGRYGSGCSNRCGKCLNGIPCNKGTGNCVGGCKTGYSPPLCQVCIYGRYGSVCNACGKCLNGVPCNKGTGNCVNGCTIGYSPPLCQVCIDGRYGSGCSNECGKCLNEIPCNKGTGNCVGGCKTGYSPPLCQVCIDGFYGPDCSNVCGNCKGEGACNKANGYCTGGCKDGYMINLCKVCDSGHYGESCLDECGHCLGSTPCDNIDGKCIEGCDPGFESELCDIECQNNTFGLGCLKECHCANNSYCNRESGDCGEVGCAQFTGLDCQDASGQKIGPNIEDDKSQGVPCIGCIGAVVVLAVISVMTSVIAVVFYMKSRRITRLYQEKVKETYVKYQVNGRDEKTATSEPAYEAPTPEGEYEVPTPESAYELPITDNIICR